MLDILKPENAIPQRRADTCLGAAATHYSMGILLNMLEQPVLADNHFSKTILRMRLGLSLNPVEERTFQYALFRYALLVGNVEQVNESCKIITALGLDHSRVYFDPNFELAVSYLWRGKVEETKSHLEKLSKIELKKNETYHFEGTTSALNAVIEGDETKLVESLELVLDGHIQAFKKYKYPLGEIHYVCESAVYITILALKYAMDIKPKLRNVSQVFKTQTHSPIDRPEIPKNKKFDVPVDLIPEYMLTYWRHHFNINTN